MLQWCSFKYKDADRIALLIGEDGRDIGCLLAWQVAKSGDSSAENVGFRSFKEELILGREPHPERWDLVPKEIQDEIAARLAAIEAATVEERPSLWNTLMKWLKSFK